MARRTSPGSRRRPTLQTGQYALKDVLPGGGRELLVHAYDDREAESDGRMTTTIYASAAGAPFAAQQTQTHRLADCFYYQMVQVETLLPSAALALLPAPTPMPTATPGTGLITRAPELATEYAAAIDAYGDLLATRRPLACLVAADELSALRDFVVFRLIVLHTAAGDDVAASGSLPLLASPGMRTLAERFLTRYEASNDLAQACNAVASYAADRPESWSSLTGWGVPGLDLTAETLCRYSR